MDVSAFGALLTTLRRQRQISQQELASRLDVHRNTISKWERGVCLPESKTLVLEVARQLRLNTQDTNRLLEASLTALSPYWQMPYQRNPFFTGRRDILRRLHDVLTHEQAAVLSQSYVLSGLGGIGKTQTAIEYAYRYVNFYTAVFWISAETPESLVSSCVAIADLLNLPEKQEQEQSRVVAAVTRWLNSHSGWLLIFDNVENLGLVKGMLPAARCGSLLFTSRRQALGLNAPSLTLEKMTAEEGLHFLLHRSGWLDPTAPLNQLSSSDEAAARAIVAAMDGLPLALDQAGSYIEATHCSLSDYLQLLQSFPLRLLDERNAHADHPLSVIKTFALAFDRLEQENSAAATLLLVCAFLAPEAIPEGFFLEGAASLGAPFEALAANPLQFQAAMHALLAYSLLQRNAATHTLMIHRLVQAVLRERMPRATWDTWRVRILTTMTSLFPSQKTYADYWQRCEQLLPHALVCLTLNEAYQQDAVARVTLMNRVTPYLTNRARFAEAESLYQQSLPLAEQALGSEHPLVIEALYGLGILYRHQGRYEEAEQVCQRALREGERALGKEHHLLVNLLNSLSVLYREQGRYEQAEEGYLRVVSIVEQLPNAEQGSLPGLLSNLADLYTEQGRYEEAEPLLLRAVSLWRQTLGVENPNLAYPLTNLAELYRLQERFEEAEALYRQAMDICEHALGTENPLISYPLYGLAELFREKGTYEQAEQLYRRALQIREQVLGAENLRVAEALTGLAALYSEQGKYQEAKPLYQRALDLLQQHPWAAETLFHLARFYQMQGQTTEARSLYQQALAMREQALGPQHPKTRVTHAAYTSLLREMEQMN